MWAFIASQLKDNKGMENIFDRYKHLLSAPVRVPKYYILRSKLKKLEKHAELVKVTQQLLQTTNDVDYKFENLDAISNEDLKILISRLTNIALVLPREFKG
ncbi:hypothetical protein KA013_03315 [Patescibacteria group bacterium]|nr:hypothetical protein [Patescibacteria group bacterium]